MGLPEAPRTVSVGLRSCYSWHFRGATTFYWASKLPSSLSQQPFNALKPSKPSSSFGLRSCYIWHFRGATTFYWASKLPSSLSQQPFNALKPSKPSSSFAMRLGEAPCAVSVGLRSCYLAFPRRCNLFLLGFETAI